MQSINIAILNPLFLTVFLGTAVGCALLIIAALMRWHAPGSIYLLVGGALYLIGSILVTMALNVPMNNALAAAAATDPSSANLWTEYLSKWTAWNHVRAIASLAAAAALSLALRY